MKFNSLIKSIPFFSTLIIILFLCFSNQRENTKLKILIWDTPTLSIGTYIAISCGSGFLFSYIITSFLEQSNQPKLVNVIKSTSYNTVKSKNEFNYNSDDPYENTLIERDIKEPSPTIKASFRVIGKIQRNNEINKNNLQSHDEMSNIANEQYVSENNNEYDADNDYDNNSQISDWYDESFSNW